MAQVVPVINPPGENVPVRLEFESGVKGEASLSPLTSESGLMVLAGLEVRLVTVIFTMPLLWSALRWSGLACTSSFVTALVPAKKVMSLELSSGLWAAQKRRSLLLLSNEKRQTAFPVLALPVKAKVPLQNPVEGELRVLQLILPREALKCVSLRAPVPEASLKLNTLPVESEGVR